MMFDENPMDDFESYPCRKCHQGSVFKNIATGAWECDTCDFSVNDNDEDEQGK